MTTPEGRGLGRRFAGHDDRSRAFGVRPALEVVAVERRPTFWPLPAVGGGPFPLDQGGEGACTGYGMAHELAAGPVQVRGVDGAYALARYRRNQETDRAMGNHFDDGATVLATMRAAKADGVITGYRWAFGVDDVVDTLCTYGPVCLGIDWYDGMYSTGPGGRLNVTGTHVGGHFITLVGYDVHRTWGPCVLALNTWGRYWGVGEARLGVPSGVGWLTLPDLGRLLASQGEAVVPADYLEAVPVPDPAADPFYGVRASTVFHAGHPLVRREVTWRRFDDAVVSGRRPCRICRPLPEGLSAEERRAASPWWRRLCR